MGEFQQAAKECIGFILLMVGMFGVPGFLWLYLDWKFRWGWFFDRRRHH